MKDVEILAQKDFLLIKYDNFRKIISIPENYSYSDVTAKLINERIVIRIPGYIESKIIIIEEINKCVPPNTLIMTLNSDMISCVEKKTTIVFLCLYKLIKLLSSFID